MLEASPGPFVPLQLWLHVEYDPYGAVLTLRQALVEQGDEVTHLAHTAEPEGFAVHERWAFMNRLKQALTDLEVMVEHRWSRSQL